MWTSRTSPALRSLVIISVLAAMPRYLSAQSLRGSPSSVGRMYHYAVAHDLHFYETSKGFKKAAHAGDFVRLSGNSDYHLSEVSFPWVKPATRTFVRRLASEYHNTCGKPMVVTSAMRPETWQPPNSAEESVHPTGIAVDLRKPHGRCLRWLRHVLLSLEKTGVIEATEEHHPPHFHVAVYSVPYRHYVRRITHHDDVVVASGDKQQYEIRPGDSLWGIARRYGTSVQQLEALNNLDSSRIRAGQTIMVPATDVSGDQ